MRHALAQAGRVLTLAELARDFMRARTAAVAELLQTLAALGHAREVAPAATPPKIARSGTPSA